jgi:hypothetical protein
VKRLGCSESFRSLLGRAIAGATAAFMAAIFVVAFYDHLPCGSESSVSEANRGQVGLRILVWSAISGAVVGVVLGKRKVSRYWLWLALIFGAICVIPVFPSKSGRLPLGTPYINGPFSPEKMQLLAIHLGLAALIALPIHILCERRKSLARNGCVDTKQTKEDE